MIDALKEFWGVMAGLLAGLVWLLRLESKVSLNAAAILRLEQQRHDDLVAAREARTATNDNLREIKGELGEIRTDIKSLIRATK